MAEVLGTKRNTCLSTQVTVQTRANNDSLKEEARSLWFSELSNWSSGYKLAEHIAEAFSLDVGVVHVWRIFERWPEPSTESSRKTLIGAFEEDDPLDLANDPLDDYYDHHIKTGNRRAALNYIQFAGYIRPTEIDLELTQDLLDRFPVSLDDLSPFLCVEPQVFTKYAKANGVVERQTPYLCQPMLTLLYRHERLKSVVCAHAQHLYRHRAVPIRYMARRMKLRWQDLWVLGSEKGYWQSPSAETLVELDNLFTTRKS